MTRIYPTDSAHILTLETVSNLSTHIILFLVLLMLSRYMIIFHLEILFEFCLLSLHNINNFWTLHMNFIIYPINLSLIFALLFLIPLLLPLKTHIIYKMMVFQWETHAVLLLLIYMYLSYYENIIFSACTDFSYPLLYQRYSDDILIISHSADNFQSFLLYMKSCFSDTKITFTHETESDNKLPYLDILISRNSFNSHYLTSVYRKPTHANIYIHPFSLVPSQYYSNLLYTFRHREYSICNNLTSLRNEFKFLKKTFLSHNYDPKIVNKIFHSSQCYLKPLTKTESTPFDFTKCIILPYMGKISYKLKYLFKRHNINIYFSSGISFQKSLFKLTQKHTTPAFIPNTSIHSKKNVIYKISCQDCDSFYIGQTKRDFNTRLKKNILHPYRIDTTPLVYLNTAPHIITLLFFLNT